MLACAGGIATRGRSGSDIGPMLAPGEKVLKGK